jgi:hypothetical protein
MGVKAHDQPAAQEDGNMPYSRYQPPRCYKEDYLAVTSLSSKPSHCLFRKFIIVQFGKSDHIYKISFIVSFSIVWQVLAPENSWVSWSWVFLTLEIYGFRGYAWVDLLSCFLSNLDKMYSLKNPDFSIQTPDQRWSSELELQGSRNLHLYKLRFEKMYHGWKHRSKALITFCFSASPSFCCPSP